MCERVGCASWEEGPRRFKIRVGYGLGTGRDSTPAMGQSRNSGESRDNELLRNSYSHSFNTKPRTTSPLDPLSGQQLKRSIKDLFNLDNL